MEEYKNYSAEDFALDDFFIKWVRHQDAYAAWFWETFLEKYPEKADAISDAKRIVILLQFEKYDPYPQDINALRNSIVENIAWEQNQKKAGDNSIKSKKRTTVWLRYAAFISIPMLMLCLGYIFSVSTPYLRKHASTKLANEEQRKNPKGQRSVLHLPDGTKVWLNAESQLHFEKNFGEEETREVYLEGEAYFDVTRDEKRPFIVHTSALSIEVLGTAFNVKSYSTGNTIETTLIHGSVSLYRNNPNTTDKGSLVLKPNQKAVFSKKTLSVNIEEVVMPEKVTSWRFDQLNFDEVAFSEVIEELERWFDVTIHVEDTSNMSCKLTAEIKNEKLEDVLALIQRTHDIRYRIEGKQVFIEGALCK